MLATHAAVLCHTNSLRYIILFLQLDEHFHTLQLCIHLKCHIIIMIFLKLQFTENKFYIFHYLTLLGPH